MNERIKELAEQAGCDILFNDDGSGIAKEDGIFFDVESFEKFALLLIRECYEWAKENGGLGTEYDYNALKEHLGVEE